MSPFSGDKTTFDGSGREEVQRVEGNTTKGEVGAKQYKINSIGAHGIKAKVEMGQST
jgi:hypothetical protein